MQFWVTPHRARISKEILPRRHSPGTKKNTRIILDPIPIKYLPEVTKFLVSLIATSIKEGSCYDDLKFVACHCANGSSRIQGIDFYKSYSPVAQA